MLIPQLNLQGSPAECLRFNLQLSLAIFQVPSRLNYLPQIRQANPQNSLLASHLVSQAVSLACSPAIALRFNPPVNHPFILHANLQCSHPNIPLSNQAFSLPHVQPPFLQCSLHNSQLPCPPYIQLPSLRCYHRYGLLSLTISLIIPWILFVLSNTTALCKVGSLNLPQVCAICEQPFDFVCIEFRGHKGKSRLALSKYPNQVLYL